MTTKRTEDMTVAETLDAIFGEGTAEQLWSGEDMETARQPFRSDSNPDKAHHVRLKVTPSGHVSPTHPAAPLGTRGGVRTLQINNVPSRVSLAEVVRLYSACVDVSDSPMREFDRLGVGRILR